MIEIMYRLARSTEPLRTRPLAGRVQLQLPLQLTEDPSRKPEPLQQEIRVPVPRL